MIVHYYRETDPIHSLVSTVKEELVLNGCEEDAGSLEGIRTESCFNVEITSELSAVQTAALEWLLAETFEPNKLQREQSAFSGDNVLEFGPRMTFTSAFSSNAVSICHACGLTSISRLELSKRYQLLPLSSISEKGLLVIKSTLHDRMTQEEYVTPIQTFTSGAVEEPIETIPIMENGQAALEEVNERMGLGFDEFDVKYYTELFQTKLGRNPTNVEVFDMGQSNSEHSRHWFFGGKMILNGQTMEKTLFQMVKETIADEEVKENSIIAFHDNSSAIRGYENCPALQPTVFGKAGPMAVTKQTLHPILTAESIMGQ